MKINRKIGEGTTVDITGKTKKKKKEFIYVQT